MAQIQVPAEQLPNHIGSHVPGHGKLTMAAVIQPGGDIVIAQFGEGFGLQEATFVPGQIVTVETE